MDIRYELHITRARRWDDNRDYQIEPKEWLDLVEADPDLVADPNNGRLAVLWSRLDGRAGVWFDWCAGNIYTADPDRVTLEKVLQIAQRLNARVLGDDGTEFVSAGQGLPIWNVP